MAGHPADAPSVADVTSYSEYSQDHEFEHDLGVIVLPVASRESAYRRIRLHGGVGIRKVKWSAARAGKPPIIPKAVDLHNDSLLHSRVNAKLPLAQPQTGTFLFHVSGEYEYVQTTPRVAGVNAIPTASYPYSVDPMDTIATSFIGQGFSVPTTVAEFDTAVTYVDSTVRRGRGTAFTWPFTAIPASFSAPTIS